MQNKVLGKQRRMTKQKKAIYNILLNTTTHPTAEWIYLEASKIMPDISLATVYRNLASLSQDGLIAEMEYTKLQTHYDGNPKPHYHFVCSNCGKILDFEPKQKELRASIEEIARASAIGQIVGHRLEFYGNCRECLDKANSG